MKVRVSTGRRVRATIKILDEMNPQVKVRQITIEREDDSGIPLLQKPADKSLRGDGASDVWLINDEARDLREADTGAVKQVLATLDQILQKSEFDGFSRVIYRNVEMNTEETFLHLIFGKSNLGSGVTAATYRQAGETVLDALETSSLKNGEKAAARLKILLNKRDGQGRTVLHHATLKWGKKVVGRLLKLGADLCIEDDLGVLPVARITPDILERFLDSKWLPRYDA